jgi:uncharacterized protein Yka (UPF0111/DUF47 family)
LAKTIHRPGWLKFLEPKHDFFAMLDQHAQIVQRTFVGLKQWLQNGSNGSCDAVHDLEHEADELKIKIRKGLQDSFVTPFDREEIYDLTERVDLILTKAKMLVKDIEYFEKQESDKHLIDMAEAIALGAGHIVATIRLLKTDIARAQHPANETRKTQTALLKIYRSAMKEAYESKDARQVVRKKQLYDYMLSAAIAVCDVGERLEHLCIKNT